MLGLGSDRSFPTVLLIDDDLISREVIATILTLNGYTLHTAENGPAALELLEQGACQPNVVLVDVQMPGLNGVELVKELRARTRAGIYAISGSQPPCDVKAAVDGFLLKPFSPDALEKLLQQSKLHKQSELGDDEPVLSEKVLGQFRQMMPEATVREIYAAVMTDLAKRIESLEAAIARRDAAEVRRLGHSVKGGCGMAGARQAARVGALLELESDDLNNSLALVTELRTARENLERILGVEFPA